MKAPVVSRRSARRRFLLPRSVVTGALAFAALVSGGPLGPIAWAAGEGRSAEARSADAKVGDGKSPETRAEARYAVLVGSNMGNDKARALRYAEEDVSRLADLLKRSGDFQDVLLIRGGTTEAVQNALQQVQAHLLADKSAGRPTLFFFYYSGHGDNEALELGASRLPLRYLREHLEAIAADVRVAFVDACHSGAMTGVKGARRAPAYEVRLADPGRVRGLAIITSSTSHEFSQESDELKASFFSHSVLSGLLGAADSSGDGQVTLSELYQYAFRRTLSSTAVSPTGGQHPTYDYRMVGTGDVVLSRVRQDDARLVFPAGSVATYMVLGRDDVMAEIPASMGEDQYVAVPSGSYQVVRRSLEGVYASTIKVAPGSSVRVEPASMVAVRSSDAIALMGHGYGGGAEDATVTAQSRDQASAVVEGKRHRIGLTAAVATSPWPGVKAQSGAGLAYRQHVGGRWLAGLDARIGKAEANDAGFRSDLWQVDLEATLGRLFVLRPSWSLSGGVFAGVPWVRQSDTVGVSSSGFGFSGGASVELAVALVGPTWAGAVIHGGAVGAPVDGRTKWRPLATGGLQLGLSF